MAVLESRDSNARECLILQNFEAKEVKEKSARTLATSLQD